MYIYLVKICDKRFEYGSNPNQQATIQLELCLFHSWGSWNCLFCTLLAGKYINLIA